jgi:DNA-binding SARP family transcriptional activator
VARVEVQLLGRPAVTVDGEIATPPRGAKSWGLLAYLAASEGGRSRSEVAGLLFAAAEDPLGALRWNLAVLRRLLGSPDVLKGDPLRLDVPEDVVVDTKMVSAGDQAALTRPGLGDELLAGLSFARCPLFETWLVTERQRLMRRSALLLREAALEAGARGDLDLATRFATKLVGCEPFDEGYHALLIRAHAAAGDAMAARHQFETCRQLLRSELGTEPGPAVAAALRAAEALQGSRFATPVPEEVQARLAVAWQSFLSGTVDHALDFTRGAILAADSSDDESLQATVRIFLGAMLGMTVRGWDEAVTVLSEAYHIDARRLHQRQELRPDRSCAVRRPGCPIGESHVPRRRRCRPRRPRSCGQSHYVGDERGAGVARSRSDSLLCGTRWPHPPHARRRRSGPHRGHGSTRR